jgi:hypothetical protein
MDNSINSSDPIGPDDSLSFAPRPGLDERMKLKIFENQAIDRPRSKFSVRRLTFGKGAPGTVTHQQRAQTYWDAFYTTIGHGYG